jgi:hypothetical protein
MFIANFHVHKTHDVEILLIELNMVLCVCQQQTFQQENKVLSNGESAISYKIYKQIYQIYIGNSL